MIKRHRWVALQNAYKGLAIRPDHFILSNRANSKACLLMTNLLLKPQLPRANFNPRLLFKFGSGLLCSVQLSNYYWLAC